MKSPKQCFAKETPQKRVRKMFIVFWWQRESQWLLLCEFCATQWSWFINFLSKIYWKNYIFLLIEQKVRIPLHYIPSFFFILDFFCISHKRYTTYLIISLKGKVNLNFLIKFLIVNQCAHVALEPVLLDLWSVILSQLAQGVKSR